MTRPVGCIAQELDSPVQSFRVQFGLWPDFCKTPGLAYDCKAEVEKLAARDPELKPTAMIHRLQATN